MQYGEYMSQQAENARLAFLSRAFLDALATHLKSLSCSEDLKQIVKDQSGCDVTDEETLTFLNQVNLSNSPSGR